MNRRYRRYYIYIIFFIFSSLAHADTIELGMSTALSGPNQFLGHAMHQGMVTLFDEVNQQGGIHGQKINLTVLDDGYEPESVMANTNQLIDQHKVIAIIGNVGTPTAAVAAPAANARGVVFYGAFTGADILRQTPPEPYIFNFRASYQQEMDVIVRDIIAQGISPHRIAFFLQDDSFGQTGYDIAKAALEKLGFQQTDQLLVTRYQRNSLSIQNAIKAMIHADPEPKAIIMVGAYKPIAKFIRFSHRAFPKTRFYSLSFSAAPVLANALAGIHGRIYMTQVVPPATLTTKIHAEDQGTIWREGYLSAQILVTALNNIQGKINSNSLKNALETLSTFHLEGFGMLSLGPNDHQASDHVWLTHLDEARQWNLVEVRGDEH